MLNEQSKEIPSEARNFRGYNRLDGTIYLTKIKFCKIFKNLERFVF